MSNSATLLDLIATAQASKEVTANAMLDAASPATLYGRRASTTAALTWGYYGGMFGTTAIANGTIVLTANITNYVQAHPVTGAVSAVATAFTANYVPLYTVVAGASTVTSYTDNRSLMMALRIPQYTTAAAPAWLVGGMYFDTTLNKLRIGGASAWETVTSV